MHTLSGKQMAARKECNPRNEGKNRHRPILILLADTKEYEMGALRLGDRPSGQEIAAHLGCACAALPATVKTTTGPTACSRRSGKRRALALHKAAEVSRSVQAPDRNHVA